MKAIKKRPGSLVCFISLIPAYCFADYMGVIAAFAIGTLINIWANLDEINK